MASIANLIQLAEALGLGLHELFQSTSAPARTRVAVHRGGGASLKDVAATGYRFRHLGGGAPLDRLEVFHLVFPRAKGMPATVSHPGQEHCYVLSGEVLFHVDGVAHRLKPGDGILIDSQLPHRAENAGRGQAHVLMTVARPAESSNVPDWWHLATSTETKREASRRDHLSYQARHLDEVEWETIRWPGETGKMLFHPTPEQPTAPNAGILRLEPGAHHPEHYHGFAQVWLVLKGEFTIDGRLCPPGTMLYHPDPHFEGEFHTRSASTSETGRGDVPAAVRSILTIAPTDSAVELDKPTRRRTSLGE